MTDDANDDADDVPMRARRTRGGFLLLWLPAAVACFVPVAFGLSPLRAAWALAGAITKPIVRDFIFLDRPMQVLLLALSLGACSPLLALPWRLLFAWRKPEDAFTLRIGRVLLGILATTNALALAVLLLGVLRGDASMLPPLGGELVGFAALAVLLLPRWRSLPRATKLVGALNAGYAGAALAACATLQGTPSPGWWLLAIGAVVAVAELGMLPREER